MASTSSGRLSRKQSLSSTGRPSTGKPTAVHRQLVPPTTLTPENSDAPFEPAAATASFLLYAQQNRVLVVHHNTLAIERRFRLHRENVLWIVVDNVSERGSGRLAVSYDAGNTAIVWDILSGAEVARFSAYEHIQVASFMHNGNIAFGNDQGNIILFEPSTSEHISARTIFDPITAIAPSADCRTFAIGYLNGSILVTTLQPSFTILHTLASTRAPSRITGLSWHGSSSKSKTDMLATQTVDGDLRVWSVPKAPAHEPPTIIRVLQRAEYHLPGPCWFAWSKNGRIVQHVDGETRSWDVRTKKVSWDAVPTIDGMTGIAIYGPGATMFTLSRNHGVQQYDLNPNGRPAMVANVRHVPADTPPTPPVMPGERKDSHRRSRSTMESASLPTVSDVGESSADEGANQSPLQRITMEMDSLGALEDELRDRVMPLSPGSSRTSSVSSRSSGGRRRERRYLYDRPDSSRAPSTTGPLTEFSFGAPSIRLGHHDSMSVRSTSSRHSNSKYRASGLRNQVVQTTDQANANPVSDLFPTIRARVNELSFQVPEYGQVPRTPELLVQELISVVFGWKDTALAMIRDEMNRHRPGSCGAVLLGKWLGDDTTTQLSGNYESMALADWMLFAMNAVAPSAQKAVGHAFVQNLLSKGDIHSAAAMMLSLGETQDAIEIYVAQQCWMEAVLLTCILFPSDWQRISFLIRRWGESVMKSQPELAVRCFSSVAVDTSEPWFSPRAQDAAYVAQQERLTRPPSAGPPLSPPSRSGSLRLAQKNASLKLITTFEDKGGSVPLSNNMTTPMNNVGFTPIAQSALPYSALSPRGAAPWQQKPRNFRDPSSARTATPSGYKARRPSGGDVQQESTTLATPITAARDVPPRLPLGAGRRTSSLSSLGADPMASLQPTVYNGGLAPPQPDQLPAPSADAFTRLRGDSEGRRLHSQERKPDGLAVHILDTRYAQSSTPGPTTGESFVTRSSKASLATTSSARGGKTQAIDEYLVGVNEAREKSRERRTQSQQRERSKKRDESRVKRGTSRPRDHSEARGRDVRYIQPSRRSPSSPVPMSPEEVALAAQATKPKPDPATSEDEGFYQVTSPIGSQTDKRDSKPTATEGQARQAVQEVPVHNADHRDIHTRSPVGMRPGADSARGRSSRRQPGSRDRSPSSPLPMQIELSVLGEREETSSDGRRVRLKAASNTSKSGMDHGGNDNPRPARSSSRKPMLEEDVLGMPSSTLSKSSLQDGSMVGSSLSGVTDGSGPRPRGLTKALAQKELEDRRLSLARRPSAPSIPLPETLAPRPPMPRANTDESATFVPPLMLRSQTADLEHVYRHSKPIGISTASAPIGLPSTPRAMRHPRYMSSDPGDGEDTPPVPDIPDSMTNLSSVGSSLSQMSNSNLGSAPSNLTSNLASNLTSNLTNATSYLTSNVSYSGSSAVSSQASSNRHVYDEGRAAGLLPSTVFAQKGAFRAASAPLELSEGVGVHPAYRPSLPQSTGRHSHARKMAPKESQAVKGEPVAVIDEALVETEHHFDDDYVPPVLPELQHLADPPPPPPPPKPFLSPLNTGSGLISIAIDEHNPASAGDMSATLPSTGLPLPMDRAAAASPMERMTAASPNTHRRGRGSVTDVFGSRFRDFGERMRSTSRNRTKSPADYKSVPYESILPPIPSPHRRRESEQRTWDSHEQVTDGQNLGQMLPPPPPPPPSTGPDGKLAETSVAPAMSPRTGSATGGFRNAKEIRANMPPHSLQSGTYPGSSENF